jgi:hypothetical protein
MLTKRSEVFGSPAVCPAVYRREVQQLAGSAKRLLASLSPGRPSQEWMRLFVDYLANKKVIASALGSIVGGTSELYAFSGAQITAAMRLLVDRACVIGDIRPDIDPSDLLWALVGFTYGNANPGWRASALRLIEILTDGLRPPLR